MPATSGDPKYSLKAAVAWPLIYMVLAMLPLGLAMIPPLPAVRSLWVEFGVTLGFIGMGLMCLQFLFSGRFDWVSPAFGTDNVQQFHRQIGIVGVILVLLHPLVLLAADPANLAYFDPRTNLLRALALSAVTVALIGIVVTTLWRERLHLSYEWWRLLHGVAALAIVFIGTVHGIQVGHYLAPLWKSIIWGLLAGGSMYLVIHTRLVRPWRMRKRPYRIVQVLPERDEVTTLALEPVGHKGMPYRAGQFAWITIGDTPFSLQQHPFSFSSGEDDPHIRFSAKALGDFTRKWSAFQPGTKAFLEGPFGAFTRDPHPHTGAFFIVGGIGITPALSILRTLHAQGDCPPAVLMYANSNWEGVTFREEIAQLERQMPLKVVHVLSDPPDMSPNGWKGESGLIDEEMIRRYLPEKPNHWEYFICGPAPLMSTAERSLRQLGVNWRRIYSERFQIV